MTNCWFDYKTVILSGASSGMGKELALRLVKNHGCKVIGIARTESKLAMLKEELGNLGHKFTYYTFDVSEREKWAELAETLKKENIQPDILINNAGILPKFDRFSHYTLEEVDKAMQINFFSCLYSINALMPLLLSSESAAIVNVSSSSALCPLAGTSVYSASKAALKSFTDALREELRGECYVGLICPGFTKTDIFRNQDAASSKSEKMMDMVSTSCDKMVDLMIDGILNKKEDMVFGADARMMNAGYKTLGTKCSMLSSKVIKMSGLEMYENVFKK